MALRAVFREIRRAAVRLDGRAAGTLETTDRLRQSLNLKAWLLPEPFSPEAIAYARGGSDAPWQRLVHYGTRRALRAQLEQDELERAAAAAANDEQQQPPVGERVSEASVQGAQEAP